MCVNDEQCLPALKRNKDRIFGAALKGKQAHSSITRKSRVQSHLVESVRLKYFVVFDRILLSQLYVGHAACVT